MNASHQCLWKNTSPRVTVDLVDLTSLSSEEIEHWRDLCQRAMSPNPFLDPDFVLPLSRNFKISDVSVLRVKDIDGRWKFATPVIQHYFEQGSPLPKLRSLRSKYTFLDQPLVCNEEPVLTLASLFDALASQRNWHGLGIALGRSSTDQSELTEFVSATSGVECHVGTVTHRPITVPKPTDLLLNECSKSRRKKLRRAWKHLSEMGQVEYRLVSSEHETAQALKTFLLLESSGWKGSEQTALGSHEEDSRFFHEMCRSFAKRGQLIFGELSLNGTVIASTCNLVSQRTVFAFKIGWNEKYSNCSLGYWSEILLSDAISIQRPEIKLIDSCSSEDSYVGHVWKGRQEIASRLFIWSRRARFVQGAKKVARALVKGS